jgi:hypothetical protein
MTSIRSIFHASQLLPAFKLFVVFQALLTPIAARNIKNLEKKSGILVIMTSEINVTTIYNSFTEFKKMYGIEFPDDGRITFTNGKGEFKLASHLRGQKVFVHSTSRLSSFLI